MVDQGGVSYRAVLISLSDLKRGDSLYLRVWDLFRVQRGITGLETAIVLIAFVVVASVFAFGVLSIGLFSSDKAQETVKAGMGEARSTLEVQARSLPKPH